MNRLALGGITVAASLLLCAASTAVLATTITTRDCPQPTIDLASATVPPTVAGWNPDQVANAAIIITVGQQMHIPTRGWVIAIATAIQESGLRNLGNLGAHNDHDSLGLFQQRPSQGWGTPTQILNPHYAATKFYQKLLTIPGWPTMPLTDAAQAVQRSAYSDAYAAHETAATSLVTALGGASIPPAACAAPSDATASGGWVMPATGPVVSGYRPPDRPSHDGIDIGAPRGAPIHAAADGVVITIACNATQHGQPYPCDRDGSLTVTGCGWYTEILHPGPVITRYCHQLRQPPLTIGQHVTAGQTIGTVGASGNVTGPHLHFEIHLGNPATHTNATNPLTYLRERGVDA